MFYAEDDLLPVMQHLAKNVITVNEGLTKQVVSLTVQMGSTCG